MIANIFQCTLRDKECTGVCVGNGESTIDRFPKHILPKFVNSTEETAVIGVRRSFQSRRMRGLYSSASTPPKGMLENARRSHCTLEKGIQYEASIISASVPSCFFRLKYFLPGINLFK